MQPAALPANETERLARLRALEVLDTLPERAYDDIAALAQAVCGTPVALISLVDEHRQWFKSRIGLDLTETPRETAFCSHAILQPDEVMVVEDARQDHRFQGNPLVVPEGPVGFYAGAPILTDDGLPLGTVCVIDDRARSLTPEQCAALKRLSTLVATLLTHEKQRREQQFQAYLDADAHAARLTAMASAALDLQAYIDSAGVYRHVNQTYLDYNACEPADVIGKHVVDHMGEALYRDVVGFQLERAMRGESVFYQRLADYKGRGPRHMEVALLPVRDADGCVRGVVMRAHDIETLKKNEVRLSRTVTLLERKTEEQQRFIHMLSHDLREPLNSVKNFSSLLADEHVDELTPDAKRYLDFIRKGGQRMGHLIDNLVEFSQLDSHQMTIRAVDLTELVTQVRETLQAQLDRCQGRIVIGTLPVVKADAALLKLALGHLLNNALKFARPGVAPLVQVSGSHDDTLDLIHVSDNGVGISQEYQQAVFSMFTRLHNRREHDGSGLGLSICQRIAELHHGRLTLESRPDQGSRFTLHLPSKSIQT